MAKQQKSKNPERGKKSSNRRSQKELLKKPAGMPSKIFKEIARDLALEMKNRNSN
jgi:hypothetical protein